MHINEQRSYTDILRAMQKVLMYMLRILRSQGIPATLLKDVFRATVLAKLTYCSPASCGYCSAGDHG